MTLILKQLFQFIKLLNSDTETRPLALGLTMGFILGMTPMLSIQMIFVFLCIFIFRIQLGAALLGSFFFKMIAYLFDPAFHKLGLVVLNLDTLQGFYTKMYNAPLVPFTKFNNTVVMGAFVLSLILSPIIYIFSKKLIEKYREKVVAKLQSTKAWKAMKATGFYKWYHKYDQLYNV